MDRCKLWFLKLRVEWYYHRLLRATENRDKLLKIWAETDNKYKLLRFKYLTGTARNV